MLLKFHENDDKHFILAWSNSGEIFQLTFDMINIIKINILDRKLKSKAFTRNKLIIHNTRTKLFLKIIIIKSLSLKISSVKTVSQKTRASCHRLSTFTFRCWSPLKQTETDWLNWWTWFDADTEGFCLGKPAGHWLLQFYRSTNESYWKSCQTFLPSIGRWKQKAKWKWNLIFHVIVIRRMV